MAQKLLIGLALILTLAASSFFWMRHELTTDYYGAPEAETFVEIPRGANARAIADLLTDAGILHARLPFILYMRWTGNVRKLQAGEFRFVEPATPIQVSERLLRGDVYFIPVTVPEGLTAVETAELVASCGLSNLEDLKRALYHTEWIKDLDPRARSLEGYLFPSTYRFGRRASAESIVQAMVDQFRTQFDKLLLENLLPKGREVTAVVILASIIEKEANNDAERQLVASVLSNRLERGMPLACDPTIIYALKLSGKYDGNIRKRDLGMESPYNTYVHIGLPPSPIANPGGNSLRAALVPAKTDLLYFVSRNDGTHQFSKDFRSHQEAVIRFQRRPVK